MVAIERVSSSPYRWKTKLVPLSRVANVEKKMPKRFIARDGFPSTRPLGTASALINGEDYPAYRQGCLSTSLKRVLLPKKLPLASFR